MKSLKLLKTVPRAHTKGGILNFRLTPDSCHALTCGQDKSVNLWNPWKGFKIKTYDNGHHGPVVDCAVAANKSTFISAGQHDKYALVWDIATGKIIRRVASHDLGMTCCLLAGNDTVAVTASVDKTAAFWDLRDRQNRRPIQVLADAYDTVTSLKQADPVTFISGSLDGFMRRYDMRMGQLTCDFVHFPITDLAMAHSTDAQCVAVMGMGNVITLLDTSVSDRARNATLNHFTASSFSNSNGVMKCVIDIEDSYVLASSEDGTVYVWDIATERPDKCVACIKDAHDGSVVNGVAVMLDNEHTRRRAQMKKDGFLREQESEDEVQMDENVVFTYGQDGSFRLRSHIQKCVWLKNLSYSACEPSLDTQGILFEGSEEPRMLSSSQLT
eukprot:Blabericola_migrator_1__2325@NODE_164_length_12331_cov_134_122880_g142_i0_p5_GENE_NODE_164_length_12331_cov_134_122880_g142_i0NODE_164_length_12331_cov_134_122880_g142_i0_p5_ORF_typecomplete_len385_score47_35WD40/PF00400_32/0_052WD40/PF00400_32/0_056WD40/PF00400_32/16WD40/PF00400_32/1e02WD40/PF00400_32/0_012WD40/PF00400_32/9_5e02ANAPC4_WD40/PF12894_7/5_2e07ANAPC4_WD40/PF12894_7/27ANAPC4_WD40/PF12894_7/0_26WD40_like/PF17005_5/0_64WD40_like/PF17005_5/5_8e06WD40_like/PF17005_5/0_07Nup160/PF11715_8/